ncbi:ATP-binding cassette domain-containing protein [Pluralibacter gergoviae]|uniref:ABC transporter ATP-binding protein/permease n=1 Tax=Pluralibacter gergoviae TaxID=61647 RepID=UPI002EDABFF9
MGKWRTLAMTLFLLMVALSLVGPWLAPFAVDDIRDMPYSAPQPDLPAGSDYLGADVLSRALSGGRMLVLLALTAVFLAWLLGGALGIIAALRGGWPDRLLLAVADILLSVPGLLLLTLVVVVTGPGYPAAVAAAVLVFLPDIFRLVRAATLQQLQQDYVEAARCRGENLAAIVCREIAPNLLPLLRADAGVRLLGAIFILATASFLGLGAAQPLADWGLMIFENRQGLTFQPWATLLPIVAILLLLIPLNLWLDENGAGPRRRVRRKPGAAPAQPECAAELADFSLILDGRPLLREVNFTLRRGEILALVGASGSGKSTLLRAALGEVPAGEVVVSGEAWLAERPLFALSARERRALRSRRVGFVSQDPRRALLPSQTIGAWLRLIGDGRGVSRAQRQAQVSAHFRQLALPDDAAFLRRYPHELSGGQRQRVMAVAAMLGFPDLLVMDEPTSALDAIGTGALMAWVAQTARRRGASVLFVAHDLPQACRVADRVLVMDDGRLAEAQTTADFLRRPLSAAGERLLAAWHPGPHCPPPAESGPPLLTIDGLTACHGGLTTLGPLRLALAPGEVLTVTGRSGGGKTTLLRVLAGLHHRGSGSLTLRGARLPVAIRDRSRSQKQAIQYVAQNPASALNPFYRVGALLARPLRLCQPELSAGQRRARVAEVLADVGLDGSLLSRRAATLSGGQQQRVALARALIARPALLLCDEVTCALDGPARLEVARLLQRLQREHGFALLLVTHDLTLPAFLGGRIMVIDNGRVVEEGRAAALLAHPTHPATRRLVDAARLTDGITMS